MAEIRNTLSTGETVQPKYTWCKVMVYQGEYYDCELIYSLALSEINNDPKVTAEDVRAFMVEWRKLNQRTNNKYDLIDFIAHWVRLQYSKKRRGGDATY